MNGAYMYVGGEDCDTMVMREEPLLDGGCVECTCCFGWHVSHALVALAGVHMSHAWVVSQWYIVV